MNGIQIAGKALLISHAKGDGNCLFHVTSYILLMHYFFEAMLMINLEKALSMHFWNDFRVIQIATCTLFEKQFICTEVIF